MSIEINDTFTESAIIDRAKKIANAVTDKELSEILYISSADFGQRKKRGTLLPLITKWAIKRNVDLNYLLRGNTLSGHTPIDPDPEVSSLMEGARRVLTSGNHVAFRALEQNIRYFDHAIAAEKRADETERKIAEMEKLFEAMKAELAELKRENLRFANKAAEAQSLEKKVA